MNYVCHDIQLCDFNDQTLPPNKLTYIIISVIDIQASQDYVAVKKRLITLKFLS